jgi:MinD superfamily P-loop ATPase
MESFEDADYCVLVAEPTVFGLENLKMVAELTKVFNKARGIVINKASNDIKMIEDFAKEEAIEILGVIPFDKSLALNNSNLKMVSDMSYKHYFQDILDAIKGGMN